MRAIYRSHTHRTSPGRLADPGRSSSWSSERICRWLTPCERERVERLELYLNPFEPPGGPRDRVLEAHEEIMHRGCTGLDVIEDHCDEAASDNKPLERTRAAELVREHIRRRRPRQ